MTKQQMITENLSTLLEYFDKTAGDAIFKLYVTALDRYTEEQLKELFTKILATCKYFPRIAEIEEMMGNTGVKQQAAISTNAHEAFDIAVATMSRVGSYRTPEFDDPLIPAVIRARFNGWARFGQIEVNTWSRKSFVEEYKALSEAEGRPQVELTGIHKSKQLSGGMKQINEFMEGERFESKG